MGSLSLKNANDFYFVGLWLADGYWRSSSVGLSSTNEILLSKFKSFLKEKCPTHNLKERIYFPRNGEKRKLIAKHVYVNSRLFTRFLMKIKNDGQFTVSQKFIPAYFAGRIDGDGHVDKKYRTGIRIIYSTKFDATRDLKFLKKLEENPASLYFYKKANTWVLYFRKHFLDKIIPKMKKYSLKLSDL